MRSENGIPRPFQPNNLAQKVADLERKLSELEARRTWVSVERIVEGGTLNQAVSNQITETVQKDLVVERENLADGALTVDGETEGEDPKRLTAQLRAGQPGSTGVARAAPALVFSLEGAPPEGRDPGIYSLDGKSLSMYSAGGLDDPLAAVTISPGQFEVLAEAVNIGAWASVGGGTVVIGNNGSGFTGSAVANVDLRGNVKLNGRTQKYIPSTQATLSAGFTHFMEGGWQGVRYSRSGDTVEVTGAWNKTSYGHQEVVCILPRELWPSAKKAGLNAEISSSGELLTVWNQTGYGRGPVAFSLMYLI